MFKFFSRIIIGLAVFAGILNICLVAGGRGTDIVYSVEILYLLLVASMLMNAIMRDKRTVVLARSKGIDQNRGIFVVLIVCYVCFLALNYRSFYGNDRYIQEIADAVDADTGIFTFWPKTKVEEYLSKVVCEDMVRQMGQYVQDTEYKLYEYPVSQDTIAVELSGICSQLNSFVQQLNEVERGSFEELQQFFAVAEQIEELPLKTRSMTEAVMSIEFILLLCILVALLTVRFDLVIDKYIEVNGGLAAAADLFKCVGEETEVSESETG